MITLLAVVLTTGAFAEETAVYELDCATDLTLAGSGVILLSGSFLLSCMQPKLTSADLPGLSKSDVNPFDRFTVDYYSPTLDHVSDGTLYTLMAAPVLIFPFTENHGDLITIAVMYAESLAITKGLCGISKAAFQRKRPYVYNSKVSEDKRTGRDPARSFYSSHTSTAFNSAVFTGVVFSRLHPESSMRYVVWSASLLLASATGYLRIRSGNHFPTDVIAGAFMGSASGWLIPRLHRSGSQVSFLPWGNGQSTGLAVLFHF